MSGADDHWLLDETRRKRRCDVELDRSRGLYALFARDRNLFPGFDIAVERPIYIGKADGSFGLKGRCHFRGGTRNHSPRRSLAALLGQELELEPVKISNPDGSFKAFGLTTVSERRLDAWMHEHLRVAIEPCDAPRAIEKLLIAQYAPLLNLEDCAQSPDHLRVSAARRAIADRFR